MCATHYPGHQKVLSLILLLQLQKTLKVSKVILHPFAEIDKKQSSKSKILVFQKRSELTSYQFQLQHGRFYMQMWTLHYQCILLFCQDLFSTDISNVLGNSAWDKDSLCWGYGFMKCDSSYCFACSIDLLVYILELFLTWRVPVASCYLVLVKI